MILWKKRLYHKRIKADPSAKVCLQNNKFNQEREAVTEEDSTDLIRSTELIARSTDAVRTYYHYASDEMGSTTHIVDETGEVQNRYEYDIWGNLPL